MKNFLRFFFVTLILGISIFTYLLLIYPRTLEKPAKSLIEYLSTNEHRVTQIEDLTLVYGRIVIKNITIHNNAEWKVSASNINIDYDIAKSITKLGFYFDINISDLKIDDITLNASGKFILKKSSTKIEDFKVTFGDNSSIEADMLYKTFLQEPYLLKANAEVIDAPLMVHKVFWHIFPDNAIVAFLKDFILNGSINGSFYVNLDKNFFASNNLDTKDLSGRFYIKAMDLKYDEVFPVVTNLNTEVLINGANVDFNITSANSADLIIKNSILSLDWSKGGDSILIGHVKADGKAIGCTRFIPQENIDAMKGYGIDIAAIKGKADVDIGVEIPLKAGTVNKYKAEAKIVNVSIDLLSSSISLANGTLIGKFDGDKVSITGPIKINGFNSNISYQINFNDDIAKDFDHAIDLKIKLLPNLLEEKKYGLSITKGSAIVNFHYRLKDNSSIIDIDSNLKNLDFLIDRAGLYKPEGLAASLKINGTSDNGAMPSKLNIALIGEGGVKILGTLDSIDGKKNLNFSSIKYGDTNLTAHFVLGHESLKLDLSGASLDLSKANLMNFLNKSADARDTDITINIGKIKMKNDIWIDNFLMNIVCDKTKCYRGAIDSKIGTRSFKMSLAAKENQEEWQFYTTNAGALLKAVGIYTRMLAGNMMLNISASRKEERAGEQISILDGEFNIKKFVITDMPFLTRMISFTSLKGVMPFNNNNKVNFVKMEGVFGYKDGVIQVQNSICEGQNFNFTMDGSVNTNSKIYKLKGFIIPSIYGFNSLLRKIPIIGNVVSAPYYIKDSY